MKNIINWLIKPFKNNFSYFLLVFLLISSIDIYYLIKGNLISYSIYICFHCYITAYTLCLIGECLPIKGVVLYKRIILLIITLSFIIDLFCNLTYHTRFNEDFATIIMQTNPAEIKEFFESFISFKFIFLIILLLSFLYTIYYFSKTKLKHIGQNIQYILLSGVVFGIILTIRNPLIYKDVLIGKIIKTLQLPTIPDLNDYLTYPKLSINRNSPQNVAIIIGESFSKSHSSLYGYNKETNPLLQTLIKDSCLHIYQNVKSPSTGTIPCFKAIMSTYKPEYLDSIPWYQCTTLPEVLQIYRYHTYWISNQSKIGLYDTVIGKYADLCNQRFYVGDKFSGLNRTNLDEKVIPLIKPLVNNKDYNFYFIHLMGSHSTFNKRYSKNFEKFKVEDYSDYPLHQRENFASYDNSILYNDSVVYEIMNLFHDKEAIVFYFSDHAIDVYESTDDYIGHARTTDPKSVEAGSQIPFMIYTSPLYQQNFPSEMEKIKLCTEQPFRTDDMIYTIMDIIGVTFEGESLEGKSLFQLSR